MKHVLSLDDRLAGNKKRWDGHKRVGRVCLVCGKGFDVSPSVVKKGKGKYCSHECANGQPRSIPRHEKSNGYVYIKSYDHPHRDGQNLMPEHRLVIEAAIGRYLRKAEVPHHIDEDKHNNTLWNLFLCKNDGEHRKVHRIDPVFLKMFNVARYQHWGDFANFDVTKDRQDQLQEMVFTDEDDLGYRMFQIHQFENRGGYMANTFEQLWLSFAMKTLYGKKWTGTEWSIG